MAAHVVPVEPDVDVVSNLTFVDNLLGACLYGDEPELAVPWLLLLSMGVMLGSLCIVLAKLRATERRSRAEVHKGAWELLSTMEQSHSAVLHEHFVITGCACTFTASTLLLLLLPIRHRGPLANLIFVMHGVVDCLALLPLLPATRRRTQLARRAVVVLAIIGARCVGVVGQPPLPQYLYPFAPTRWSMYVNGVSGAAHVLLLARMQYLGELPPELLHMSRAEALQHRDEAMRHLRQLRESHALSTNPPQLVINSATVATGALYIFRASKWTGAHTPCMATGDTIWAHACALTGSMAPLLEMPFASILGRVNDEKIVIKSRDKNNPYEAKGMAFLPAPLPPYILANATSFAMHADALTAVVPINVAATCVFCE